MRSIRLAFQPPNTLGTGARVRSILVTKGSYGLFQGTCLKPRPPFTIPYPLYITTPTLLPQHLPLHLHTAHFPSMAVTSFADGPAPNLHQFQQPPTPPPLWVENAKYFSGKGAPICLLSHGSRRLAYSSTGSGGRPSAAMPSQSPPILCLRAFLAKNGYAPLDTLTWANTGRHGGELCMIRT